MAKIIRQSINPDFLPVSPQGIREGDTLSFDCYIRRYKDYVVIIPAGTLVTPELKGKVALHKYIYIAQADREKYKTYSAGNAKQDLEQHDNAARNVEQAFATLRKDLQACANLDEKLALFYPLAVDLMHDYFQGKLEKIPQNQILIYAEMLTELLENNHYVIEDFLCYMPDHYTEETHSVNVSLLSTILAREIGLSLLQQRKVAMAGILHDIGKQNIDREILHKKEKLELDEYEKVQEHPVFSMKLARDSGIRDSDILATMLYHHEKLDGSGYPDGLMGDKIPMMAQILGICDVFDSMTTDHVYRARYSSFDALMLMKKSMRQELNMRFVDILIRRLAKG